MHLGHQENQVRWTYAFYYSAALPYSNISHYSQHNNSEQWLKFYSNLKVFQSKQHHSTSTKSPSLLQFCTYELTHNQLISLEAHRCSLQSARSVYHFEFIRWHPRILWGRFSMSTTQETCESKLLYVSNFAPQRRRLGGCADKAVPRPVHPLCGLHRVSP